MRIGIVTEQPASADLLRRAVRLRPEHVVDWTAKSGGEAVELCARVTPDLILMDLVMLGMDGVEATRRIMASAPCAILIVTGSVHINAARVFEAMGCGALDAVDMPDPRSTDLRGNAAPLLAKIATISRLMDEKKAPRSARTIRRPTSLRSRHTLVAIGASAGGPAALAAVLRALPTTFPAAIVIVQHVDARFASGMAEWLSQHSALPVRVATEGDHAVPGTVLLAGTADHLALTAADRVGYEVEPRFGAYRPSIDVFFQSVSRYWRGDAIGVLLTGMGRDGALGLKALRDKGHYTIAQDQASSAVYGMPKAAVTLGAAVDVLAIEQIAARLIEVLVCKA